MPAQKLCPLSVVVAAALAGCAGTSAPPSAPAGTAQQPSAPRPCDAQPAQSAIGQSGTASVVEAARVRAGAQQARLLRPGQIITKEFNAQRLNLEVDAGGRVTAVHCG